MNGFIVRLTIPVLGGEPLISHFLAHTASADEAIRWVKSNRTIATPDATVEAIATPIYGEQ